jgi:hypothetical protein
VESFGTAARRLLAGLERDVERKAKKASERPQNGSEKFGPETSQEGALKSRVSVTGEERRDEWEKNCGQVGPVNRAAEGLAAMPIACPPPSGDTIAGGSRRCASNVHWIDFRNNSRHGSNPWFG